MVFKKKLAAFSLIELGIVLLVIGVLAVGVFKGKDILDSAKLQSTIQEIQHIQQGVHQYTDLYHALPGDDPDASRFGDTVQNGNGNRIIDGNEQDLFWVHLFKAGMSAFEKNYPCKMGGVYTVEQDSSTLYLVVSNPNQAGLLTPKQAKIIESKLGSNAVDIADGKDNQGLCLSNGVLNLKTTRPVCIVKIKINA
ncbi:MAG: hypothetical protein NEHIOOID_00182 [Holosporales bacterium]